MSAVEINLKMEVVPWLNIVKIRITVQNNVNKFVNQIALAMACKIIDRAKKFKGKPMPLESWPQEICKESIYTQIIFQNREQVRLFIESCKQNPY